MSTSTPTKKTHRETPTQALRRQLTEAQDRLAQRPDVAEMERLTADNARLDGSVKALAKQLASVSEHLFLTGGTGEVDRFLAKRHNLASDWAVLDGTLMAARYWGRDGDWHSTCGATVAQMFAWSEEEACRYARILAEGAVLPGDEVPTSGVVLEDADALADLFAAALPPADEALVDAHLKQVGEQLTAMVEQTIPAAEVEDRLQEALATAAARHANPVSRFQQGLALIDELAATAEEAGGVGLVLGRIEGLLAEAEAVARHPEADPGEAEDDTITIPAPADVPGYEPEPADPDEADTILTPRAASISANTEQPTVALPQARNQGPEETTQMPVISVQAIPPKPKLPPVPDVPLTLGPAERTTWVGKPKPLADALGFATSDLKQQVSAAALPRRGVTVRLPKGGAS